jgi:hypothetical protein
LEIGWVLHGQGLNILVAGMDVQNEENIGAKALELASPTA